jgi:hypothetical protein
MRRPTLAVFLATTAVAVGAVVVVTSSRGGAAAPIPTSAVTTPSAIPTPTRTVDTGCRMDAGPKRLATVPEQVSARVDRAWERIETWLAEHAPVTAAALRPPAGDETIAATQQAVGVRLPPELVASLRRHDGVGDDLTTAFTFPPFWSPLSAANIAGEAKLMCDVLDNVDEEAVGAWWHGRYVPVATDHGGELLFLDGGRLGRHYEADDVTFDGSYAGLLEQTADALFGQGEYRPVVVDGRLEWD